MDQTADIRQRNRRSITKAASGCLLRRIRSQLISAIAALPVAVLAIGVAGVLAYGHDQPIPPAGDGIPDQLAHNGQPFPLSQIQHPCVEIAYTPKGISVSDRRAKHRIQGMGRLLFAVRYPRYRVRADPVSRSASEQTARGAYIPVLRRLRRISTEMKSDSLLGTDFTLDDFWTFLASRTCWVL